MYYPTCKRVNNLYTASQDTRITKSHCFFTTNKEYLSQYQLIDKVENDNSSTIKSYKSDEVLMYYYYYYYQFQINQNFSRWVDINN